MIASPPLLPTILPLPLPPLRKTRKWWARNFLCLPLVLDQWLCLIQLQCCFFFHFIYLFVSIYVSKHKSQHVPSHLKFLSAPWSLFQCLYTNVLNLLSLLASPLTCLKDHPRKGEKLTLSPSGTLAAITDSLGRILLLDTQALVVVRLWKVIICKSLNSSPYNYHIPFRWFIFLSGISWCKLPLCWVAGE